MRIFIIQHYSPNKGDSAVLSSMISSLKKYEGVEIVVSSYDPYETEKLYGIKSVGWIVDFKSLKTKKACFFVREAFLVANCLIWAILRLLSIDIPLLNKSKKSIVCEYLNADVVVVPGGHFFTSLNNIAAVFCHCFALYFGQLMLKPTMVYSHTIGPFEGLMGKIKETLCRYVLKRTDLITVREKKSVNILKKLGISDSNIIMTAETVFLMNEPDKNAAEEILKKYKIKSGIKVGITIHHIYFKYFFTRNQYIDLMAELSDFLVEHLDAEVIFIPMEMKYDHGGDRPMANEIINKMRHSSSAKLLDGEYTPSDTLGLIDQMDLFVGTKTHSIIFSLLRSNPTISISYHPKSTEFMEQLGVKHYAIPLEDLNIEIFKEKVIDLWANKEAVRNQISMNLVKVKRETERNNKLLLGLVR